MQNHTMTTLKCSTYLTSLTSILFEVVKFARQ